MRTTPFPLDPFNKLESLCTSEMFVSLGDLWGKDWQEDVDEAVRMQWTEQRWRPDSGKTAATETNTDGWEGKARGQGHWHDSTQLVGESGGGFLGGRVLQRL